MAQIDTHSPFSFVIFENMTTFALKNESNNKEL